jgi:hypothetical protein
MNKMGVPQSGVGEDKKGYCWGQARGKRENTLALAKVYSCFSRARGLTMYIFFFINNRVLGV